MIKNLSFHFIFIFTIIFLLILGYWQTQRLEWKNNLINSIQQNYSEYLEEFPFHVDNSNEYEFMKVVASGYLKFENTMYFYRSNLHGAPGFDLIVPMLTEENKFVYLVLDFTYRLTEPLLFHIRRFLPNLGAFDISPIILLLLIWFVEMCMKLYLAPILF